MARNLSRPALAVCAAAVLVSLTAACGGGGQPACQDAVKAFQDYSTQAAAGAGNLDAFNKANADLATKLKNLSDQADGDLKATLADLSATWGGIKIDPANPAAAATELSKLSSKASEATQKLASNCS
ncbi:hypothetical protein ABGB17_00965 [Sphaerisporangium sp. B11E5]|uniref:hypothetical protein n=1 Tax=Sphaerisporangium sp. B11E5 TaxID=3153563 RepID=UPI00325F593E